MRVYVNKIIDTYVSMGIQKQHLNVFNRLLITAAARAVRASLAQMCVVSLTFSMGPSKDYTPKKTNMKDMTMENQPRMKIYLL